MNQSHYCLNCKYHLHTIVPQAVEAQGKEGYGLQAFKRGTQGCPT